MRIHPRSEVTGLTEAIHGGIVDSELERFGVDADSIIDFSASVNPLGPSSKVLAAITQTPLHRYPDRDCRQLKSVLSRQLSVPPQQLLIGNGTGELLWLLALSFLRPRDCVLIVGPTYSEYARSTALMGATCLNCNAEIETGFCIPVEAIAQALKTAPPRIVYLCNPNNPTGKVLAPGTIESWARQFDQTLFVVDEAYFDFSFEPNSLLGSPCENIVILRSLSKSYGLGGLRLGYLIADAAIVDLLSNVRVPWSVNAVAQLAGTVALQDEEHQQRSRRWLVKTNRALIESLRSLGLKPVPSAAFFFLLPVLSGTETRSRLLQAKILVRDCTSFGLPGFIRVATRQLAENVKLVSALSQLHSRGEL